MLSSTDAAPRRIIRTAPAFFANSIIAVALAVGIARLVEMLGVAVVGAFAGREPVVNHVFTTLRVPGSEPVELAAPAASLIVGIVLLMLYPGSKDRSAGRLLMLWTLLFCFRNALVEVARAAFDENTALGGVLSESSLDPNVVLTFSILAIVGLVLVSVGAAPAFLSFSRHRSEISTWPERLRFMASIALVPGMLGPLAAIPFFVPDQGSGVISLLPQLGVFVVVTTIAGIFVKSVPPPEVIEERGLALGLLSGYAFLFLVYRFGLGPGLVFPPWDENLRLTWRP